jgi:hypothetical protein
MNGILAAMMIGVLMVGTIRGGDTGMEQEKAMTEAKGSFEVKLVPGMAEPGMIGTQKIGLDKVYHGDLEATGKGLMLSSGDPGQGSAGYVAMERVTGALAGRTGSFALMQMGTMAPGVGQQLTVTVVPGSGAGDLSGIYGGMTINIAGGKHSYVLSYAFAAK